MQWGILVEMAKILNFLKRYKSYIFLGLIVILILKVFIPQLDQLEQSLKTLEQANLLWVLAALLVFFSGLPIVTVQYMVLALRKLPFWLTFRVQMAGLFVSKLLPSSLGTITLNMYYFTKRGYNLSEGTTMLTMNGITSTIAYSILIFLALLSDNFKVRTIFNDIHIPLGVIFIVLAVLLLLGFGLLIFGKIRHKIYVALKNLAENIKIYKHRPHAISISILTNGLGSFTGLFALYASAHALGVDLTLSSALLAYTFGNIAAGLIPTPGGLGAAEAGLYSGLVVVGVGVSDAVSVTMLYRLISYWIPILPGYYYFWDLRKTILSKFSFKKNYADKASA